MNNLIIFDLDGVLIDSKEIHYEAFNKSLESFDRQLSITKKEHLSEYDGLSKRKNCKN